MVAGAGSAGARTYGNDAFGISVEIPRQLLMCRSLPPAPDRGFVVMLGAGTCDDEHAPRISLALSYNALLEHRSTQQVARDWCGGGQATWAPFAAGGVRMMVCDRPSLGGLATRLFIALRAVPGVWFGEWVVLAISVQCGADEMPECTKVAGELARGVRWRH